MTHPRKIIRNAVAAAIEAAGTLAEERVWAAREPPVDVDSILIDQGPVVLVYTRSDRSPKDGHSPSGEGWVKRELDLVVEVIAAGTIVLDDRIDDMAEQIEAVVDVIEIAGMVSAEVRHVETEIETTAEFETPIGSALIRYEVTYWREWRVTPETLFPCPTDVGVKVNGGPREAWKMLCCEADA